MPSSVIVAGSGTAAGPAVLMVSVMPLFQKWQSGSNACRRLLTLLFACLKIHSGEVVSRLFIRQTALVNCAFKMFLERILLLCVSLN